VYNIVKFIDQNSSSSC